MTDWNHALSLALNASASPDPSAVLLALIAAKGFVYAGAAIAAGLWIWGAAEKRAAVLATAAGLVVAFAISWTIAATWYAPRPSAVGIGHTIMAHAPETSFPSDHATFLWTLGFGLIAFRACWTWGWLVALLGLLTAWARIYLGVHFPIDMLGSIIVALISAALAKASHPLVARRLLPVVIRFYEKALALARLSPRIFPRHVATERRLSAGRRKC